MGPTERQTGELLAWLESARHRIESLEPDAPLMDLAPLRVMIGDALVIGIGETVRGARSAHELRRFAHRVLRLAVEHLGARTLVIEEQSLAAAAVLDASVRGGARSSRDALGDAWAPWQTLEVVEVLDWLRARNEWHAHDPVRIVGAISEDELGLAGHVLEHLDRNGAPVAYWGGAAHSAVAPASDVTYPPRSPSGASDGARLRRALGGRYVSIACVCDHSVAGEPLPPPPGHFTEAPLARVGAPAWYIDLRHPDDESARQWVTAPATTRLIGPRYDPGRNADFRMSGSPLGHWFDVVLYVREITPTRPLDATLDA